MNGATLFKKMSLIVFLAMSCGFSLQADSVQDAAQLFAQGNQRYKAGDFAGAQQLYKQIEEKTAQVYYNLGNCAYKLGKPGYALLYWRRAEREWGFFGRRELEDNIALVRAAADKVASTEQGLGDMLSRYADRLVSYVYSVPLFFLQMLFLLLWIFLFVYLKYLYRHKKNKIIVVLFACIAASAVMLALRMESKQAGVVVSTGAALWSGPGENFQRLGGLPEAEELVIYKESDDFFKVGVKRQIGWVKKSEVEMV